MNIQNIPLTCTNGNSHETNWDICEIISPGHFSELNYAVLILNRPVTQNHGYFLNLWNSAKVRITVDGGTRQWDLYLSTLSEEEQRLSKKPDLVTGDFDSITEEILQKYKSKGCKNFVTVPIPEKDSVNVIVHTPDQNFTDFTKALIQLNDHVQNQKLTIDTVIVVGQSSGRVDQTMGNIQTLFLCKEKQILPLDTNVYLMSDDALSWLLYPGNHRISVPEDVRNNKKPWCALIPVGQKCDSVTTSGLKWNLDSASLKFGEIISTSNTYNGSPTVTISCSHTILWSMKVPNLRGW